MANKVSNKKSKSSVAKEKVKNMTFNVGDEVYFSKYTREVDERILKPGSVYDLIGTADIDGQEGFILKNKAKDPDKVVTSTALPSEIKIKRAAKTIQTDAENVKTKRASSSKKEQPTLSAEEEAARQEELAESRFKEKEQKAVLDLLEGRTFSLTENLQEQLEGQKTDPLELALSLDGTSQSANFDVGGVLSYIFTEGLYRTQYGYDRRKGGFNAFVDQKIPGMGSRKARNLMDIYITFTSFGIPVSVVIELGWSACARIVALKDEKTIRNLIHYMQTPNEHGTRPTIKELEAEIKVNYKSSQGSTVTDEDVETQQAVKTKFKHVTFSFTEENHKLVTQTLDILKQQYPDVDNDAALMVLLCSEYLSNVQDSGALTEEEFIQKGELVFPNKQVFIRDKRSGEVSSSSTDRVNIHISKEDQEQTQELEIAHSI